MNCFLNTPVTLCLIVVGGLCGCNSNASRPDEQSEIRPAATQPAESKRLPEAEAPMRVLPAAEVKNPTLISFDKLSVVLDDKAREVLALSMERARQARRIVVTGYSDKRMVANPNDAAVARALAVRDEYVRLGIAPTGIAVKFVVTKPNTHAAEIRFE